MSARTRLDDEEATELQRWLMEYYRIELDRQEHNRFQQLIDHDFYDSVQWGVEDAQELMGRGQAPTVFNMIAPACNWILGTEQRTTMDARVLPRRAEGEQAAQIKTQLLKYLSDINRTPHVFSRAFEDAVKSGLGWIEDGLHQPEAGKEPLVTRYEDWRCMLWDSTAKEADLSDARYLFRSKIIDVDLALTLFPKRPAQIKAATLDAVGPMGVSGDDVDDAMASIDEFDDAGYGVRSTGSTMQRRRLRLYECWYTVPRRVQRLNGGEWHGQTFEEGNADQRMAILAGQSSLATVTAMEMRVAVMTARDLLYDGPTPYRHNRYPFTPVWGYRRKRDGMPYGVIRHMRDIQVDMNKRASKALFILSSNKVIVEENNVDDWQEFEEAVSLPNGIIKVRNVAGIRIDADRDLAAGHLELMGRNAQMIQNVSGVTDELMGRTTNAVSGRAITARQEQGGLATSTFFSNLRLARQISGEKRMALMEQFMTERKVIRITGSSLRAAHQFVVINDPELPDSQIDRNQADFVMDEMDWQATWRQAMTEQLIEMMQKLPPEMAMLMFDLVVEMMDVPNKEEILTRIRGLTGMGDSQGQPTPEQMAQQQAEQEQAQMQQQLAEKQIELELALAEQNIAEAKARTAKLQAEAGKVAAETVRNRVGSMSEAMAVAATLVSAPAVAASADSVLQDVGFTPA